MAKAPEGAEAIILELCSEDDWGSWELYWNVRGGNEDILEDVLQKYFVDTIEQLVSQEKIVPREKGGADTSFSRSKLEEEVRKEAHPDNSFYWFGVPGPQRRR